MRASIFLAAALLVAADVAQAAKHFKKQTYGEPLVRVRTSCYEGPAKHAVGDCCTPPELDDAQKAMIDEMKVMFENYERGLAGLQRSAASKADVDAATELMIQRARERVESARVRLKSKVWDDDNVPQLYDQMKEDYQKAGAFMQAATPGLAKAESKEHAQDREETEAASALRRSEKAKSLASGVALADIPVVGKLDLGSGSAQPAGGPRFAGGDVYKRDEQRSNLAALRERNVDDGRPSSGPRPVSGAAAFGAARPQAPSGAARDEPLILKAVGRVGPKGGFGRRPRPGEPTNGPNAEEDEEEPGPQPQREPKAASPAQALIDRTWELINAGDFEAAEEEARKALLLDPSNPRALEVLALAQLKQGKYEEAIRTATGAIELDPRAASAWAFRAFAKDALGDFAGSLADIEQAARLESGYAERFRIAKAGGRIWDATDFLRARSRHRARWLVGAALCPLLGFLAWWILLRRRRQI